MKKTKLLVLGYFGFLTNQLDGQTIKTRNIFKLLKEMEQNESYSCSYFDSQIFKKNKLKFLKMIVEVIKTNTLVYIPAHNNLKYFFPLIFLLSKIFNTNIHYVVVGGWLADFISNKPVHIWMLKKIKGIYPQSDLLTNRLETIYKFNNVATLNNFRIHSFDANINMANSTFKIVFMARVHPMKGVDDLFKLADYLEPHYNFKIDIYGPIYSEYEENFFSQLKDSDKVSYKGILQPEEIYKTLNNYDLMILPTKYYTEGFPGSVLDAYIAGVPVVVSDWKHAHDFVDNGESGLIYEFDNTLDFFAKVHSLLQNRPLILNMKEKAKQKGKEYSSEVAWKILKDKIIV